MSEAQSNCMRMATQVRESPSQNKGRRKEAGSDTLALRRMGSMELAAFAALAFFAGYLQVIKQKGC